MKVWKIVLATLVIFATGVVTGGLLVGIADGVRERRHFFQQHWLANHPPATAIANPPAASSTTATNGVAESNREPRLVLPFGKPPGRGLGKEFLERLNAELNLAADQHKRIEKIIEDSQKRTREVLRDEMKHSREAMHEILTPDQNRRLDELLKRLPKPPKENKAPIATNSYSTATNTPAGNL